MQKLELGLYAIAWEDGLEPDPRADIADIGCRIALFKGPDAAERYILQQQKEHPERSFEKARIIRVIVEIREVSKEEMKALHERQFPRSRSKK